MNFKPVFGDNVPNEDKKINDKAYKDIMKDTENFNSKVSKKRRTNYDGGRSK